MMSGLQAVTHYLIERELGRGAMGVVYLGFDTKLSRQVAVKSLPADLAMDADRKARFEDEARTLAAINHPNIASIYGLEQQGGSTYLILEFVEGPTLTERLISGVMELEEALGVCRQVAGGIDAAHQRGIVHRDLKPENIKLRPDGVVKVLDFGIAMAGDVQGPSARTDTPTIAIAPHTRRTAPGLIVGTPGYMSPEQARGKAVGKQTDLWSLGCVLYECLTGAPIFTGESLADALAATLHAEPDWSRLPPRTPASAVELLRKCLQKDFRMRPESMAWACEALDKSMLHLKTGVSRVVVSTAQGDDDWPAGGGSLVAPAVIGRDRELGEIARLNASSRLVTLTGPAGAGRSSLALAAGAALRDKHAAGAWSVRLPPLADADLPATIAAMALGARGAGGPAAALAGRIAARPALLVMTGCEHSPTACASLVFDLLAACPNLRLITTARAPMGLEGEATLPIGGLASPAPDAVARGEGKLDAARLFVERLKNQDASFRSSAESTTAIAELCRRLGGWPLAVELCAALTASLSVSDIAERLEQRARILGVSGLEMLPADGIHRLVIRWILDTLPPGELAILLAASAFVGTASVRALCAAGGARDSLPNPESDDPTGGPSTVRETRTGATVMKLVARGVLELKSKADDAAHDRVSMHESVRRVAGEWLRENSAVESAVVMGHRAYHLASAEQASRRWAGAGGSVWMQRAEAEYADLVYAARQTREADPAGGRLRELIGAFRSARGL